MFLFADHPLVLIFDEALLEEHLLLIRDPTDLERTTRKSLEYDLNPD